MTKDNELRFNTYRERTIKNEENDSNKEESNTLNDFSLLEKESRKDLGDNEIDEEDVSKQ